MQTRGIATSGTHAPMYATHLSRWTDRDKKRILLGEHRREVVRWSHSDKAGLYRPTL